LDSNSFCAYEFDDKNITNIEKISKNTR